MRKSVFLAVVLSAAAMGALACSKDDAGGGAPATAAPASAATLPPATDTATARASAPAAATASAAASATATAPASASAGALATAAASGSAASAKGAATCGDKPLPPCPLAAWMKKNTSSAMTSQDFDALATALDKVAGLAPKAPGYPNWVSISRDGAAAARVQNLDAVKASCRGCHNQYKDKYKKELRDRPI